MLNAYFQGIYDKHFKLGGGKKSQKMFPSYPCASPDAADCRIIPKCDLDTQHRQVAEYQQVHYRRCQQYIQLPTVPYLFCKILLPADIFSSMTIFPHFLSFSQSECILQNILSIHPEIQMRRQRVPESAQGLQFFFVPYPFLFSYQFLIQARPDA